LADAEAKVLIVEDDLLSLQYYSFIFDGKYEICMVPTVEDAKQALAEHSFKVAIVDISLPGGKSGIDLIKNITQELAGKPPPIVVTALAFPEIRLEALEAGAAEFFTKPIMSDVLLDAVEKYLKL